MSPVTLTECDKHLQGHIQLAATHTGSYSQALTRTILYRQATLRVYSYLARSTYYASAMSPVTLTACDKPLRGHIQLAATHTDRLSLVRTSYPSGKLILDSQHLVCIGEVTGHTYGHAITLKRLQTRGDLSISPKSSVVSVQRPLFIYFYIYHLGFIQISVCASADVSRDYHGFLNP